MRASTFTPAATLDAKLEAVAAHVVAGSRHPAIRARVAAAVRDTGGDAWRAFVQLYDELRAKGVRLPDPGHAAGEDRIEPADVTLDRLAGDCDDWTVLVLALARSLGFRGSAVTLSDQAETGELVPLHIFATIEGPAGADVAADLAESLPLGTDPIEGFPTAAVREVWPLEAAAGSLGFLDGVLGLVSTVIGGKNARRNARDARAAAEAQAGAASDQARAMERQAEADQVVGLAAIRESNRSTTIQALLRKRDQDNARASLNQAFGFLREMAPVGLALVGLSIVAPLAQTVIEGK